MRCIACESSNEPFNINQTPIFIIKASKNFFRALRPLSSNVVMIGGQINKKAYYSTSPIKPFVVKPVITYDNADTAKVDIFADNRNKSGVYR